MARRDGSRRPRGMALGYVVIVVGIIGILVAGFTQFRSMVMRQTGDTADELLARQAAEAGVNAVLAEMQGLSTWQTHDKATDDRDPTTLVLRKVDFSTPALGADRHPVNLQASGPLKLDPFSSGGAYCGQVVPPSTFGMGFPAEFRVKAATHYVQSATVDDESDLSVDVKTRFFRIVSMGRRKSGPRKRSKIVRIAALVEASNLTEYTIYDGAFLDLGMGMKNDPQTNVFSVGRLYGNGHLALADIESNGTRQKFDHMGKMLSSGPILFDSNYPSSTFGEGGSVTTFSMSQSTSSPWKNTDSGGTDLSKISIVDSQTNLIKDNTTLTSQQTNASQSSSPTDGLASDNIKDGNHGGKQPEPELSRQLFDSMQPGPNSPVISLKNAPQKGTPNKGSGWFDPNFTYSNPYTGSMQVAALFFGRARYGQGGDDPLDYASLGATTLPVLVRNDTGKPLLVWGNPDRDVTIYSQEDVYVCGDFNQHERHFQGYDDTPGEYTHYKERVRFVQQDDVGSEKDDDSGSSSAWWDQDRRDDTQNPERKACAIISDKRIWFDYRYPSRLLRNEMRPYVEYLLIKALRAGDPSPPDSDAPDVFAYKFINAHQSTYSTGASSYTNLAYTTPIIASTPDTSQGKPVEQFVNGASGLNLSGSATATTILGAIGGKSTITLQDVDAEDTGLVDQILDAMEQDEVTQAPSASGWWTLPNLYCPLSPTSGQPNVYAGDPVKKLSKLDSNTLVSADCLYVPEHTINAVLIDCAERNCDWNANPHSVDKIFPEIGNFDHSGNAAYKKYLPIGSGVSPVVGRVFGSEIHLRNLKDASGKIILPTPKLTGGVYDPHKRKRIYDRTLRRHPPGYLPRVFKVWSWEESGVSGGDQDFDGF